MQRGLGLGIWGVGGGGHISSVRPEAADLNKTRGAPTAWSIASMISLWPRAPAVTQNARLRSHLRFGRAPLPPQVIIGLLRAAMVTSGAKEFLIDGFPRAMDQAARFEEMVKPCQMVLFFDCPEEVMEARLLKRGETSGRSDDNAETIRKRFKTFVEQSLPVIDHYESIGKACKIDATVAPDEVFVHVCEAIDAKMVGAEGLMCLLFAASCSHRHVCLGSGLSIPAACTSADHLQSLALLTNSHGTPQRPRQQRRRLRSRGRRTGARQQGRMPRCRQALRSCSSWAAPAAARARSAPRS